ncbi:MAG TPA: hypothetical protein PKC49_04500 [Phycisphaerae bacterium]|nr:hypothetical protein [Phycisphaerae bacterium]
MNRAAMPLSLAVLALASGCADVKVSLYKPEAIGAVRTWDVDFTYEAGRYEEVVGTERGQEQKVVKEGHPPVDLQLRDDIFFRLRDRHGVQTVKDVAEADGLVRIHPVHFAYGGFKSLDVTMLDRADEILARIRIQNGDRNATFKDNDEFAEYCADAVGDVITGKRRK